MSELKKHFLYKLLTNFIRIPISFALQSIFPRLLGPVVYGNYDFLLDNANKTIAFFENGISFSFYTKLSQNNRDTILVKFYACLVLIISALYFVFVAVSGWSGLYKFIWPSQLFFFIVLNAVLGILTYWSDNIMKMVDACNLTVSGEKVRMIQLVLSLILCFSLYHVFHQVSLDVFYYQQIFLIFVLIVGNWYILRKVGQSLMPDIKLTGQDIRQYSKSFWQYSNPLILYSFIALIGGVGERWILQVFSGSVEQAYFGLSYKVGAFVFLFAGAIMPLLMREFSRSYGSNDIQRLSSLFLQNLKILYFLAAFLSVFVSLNGDLITSILAGKGYEKAGIVVSLMAFYPIHQTIGQLNGTLYYSTNRTREYRNLAIFIIPFSLIACFFFIAPHAYFGLALGAKGLVYEMLLVQFIGTNILLYSNCRFLKTSFINIFSFQILVIILIFSLGYGLFLTSGFLSNNLFVKGAVHFVSFSLSISLIVFLFPSILGINNRAELVRLISGKR